MTEFFHWRLLTAVLISASLLTAFASAGTNYYVSKTGSDSPLNGTISNPWLTIQYAIIHDSVEDGDTINVANGTYTEAIDVSKSLNLRGSGSSATIIAAPGDLFSNLNYLYQNSPSLFNQRVALVHIAPGKSVMIEGFTIDGQNSGPVPATFSFTGIMVEQASATIKGNTVKNFLPSDTSGAPNASLSGRGIEVLGGAFTSLIDSNIVQSCQRHHILITATDDKSGMEGVGPFPMATVSRNTITGLGLSKHAQKGIWFNWGAFGAIVDNSVGSLDYNTVTDLDRASGIIVKHGEYRAGGASRVLISGNTVTTLTSNNNKGIFIEGKGDSVVQNNVSGFHFNIQVDDEDSAYVLKNTVTGGKVGVLVTRTTPPLATNPFFVAIGGSASNKNTFIGQPKTYQGGAAISLSFRNDIELDGNFTSTVPVVATYNDFGVYSANQIDSLIHDRKDTTTSVPPIDTVLYQPFYTDKIRASVKVYLQGPYVVAADSMSNPLRTGGHLASHFGGTIPTLAVDSVNIELRNAATAAGSTTRKFAPAWLLTNGTIRSFADTTKNYVEFDTTSSGNYYIVVRHRNHLAVMCSTGYAMDGSTSPTVHDFSTAQTQAYGTSPMVAVGTRFAMWAGDVSGNGQLRYNLGGNDRLPILTRIGGTNINATVNGYYSEDVNMNGQVRYNLGGNDRLIILTNIGGTNINATRNSQVP
jgi:hypothetical protein